MEHTIFAQGSFRILEVRDTDADAEMLAGDFPEEIPALQAQIDDGDVYGYVLEKWNAEVGVGWEHVDSGFGFVGTHAEKGHYIVCEFMAQIKELSKKKV